MLTSHQKREGYGQGLGGGGGGETETDRQRRTVRQRHDDIISLEKSRQRSGPDKTEMPFNDETVSRYTGFFTSVLLS